MSLGVTTMVEVKISLRPGVVAEVEVKVRHNHDGWGTMMVGTAHRAFCHLRCVLFFKDTDVYLKENLKKKPSKSATINCSRQR